MNASSSVAAPRAATSSCRRVRRQHPAGIHQRNPIAALGFVHEMGRDENRHALLRERSISSSQNRSRASGIDPRGRLVEDQHLGLVDDRDGEREPLANPERQIRGALIEIVGEAEPPDQLGDPRRRFLRRQMKKPRMQFEILPDRQFRIERERLRHVPDPVPRPCRCASSGWPNNSAPPSVGGSSPVSIFMVVVLPQPFEPRKPKISPRSMVKLTRSTAVKSPNRQVRSRAVMTGSASRTGAAAFAAW